MTAYMCRSEKIDGTGNMLGRYGWWGFWGELDFKNVEAVKEIDEERLAYQEAYDLGFRAVSEVWE